MDYIEKLKYEEKILQNKIKSNLIKDKWKLLKQEYLIIENYYQFGTGDLLFLKNNKILVVECKYINFKKSGRNYRSKRTKARKKVKEQALYYSSCAKINYKDYTVYGSIYTNENDNIKIICKINKITEAIDKFKYFFKKQHKLSCFNKKIEEKLKEFLKKGLVTL